MLINDDGPLAYDEGDDDSEFEDRDDSDELEEPNDGALADEEADNGEDEGDNESDDESSSDTESNGDDKSSDERPGDPTKHVTWTNHNVDIVEQNEMHGGSEVFVAGRVESEIEIAGLPVGETLSVEIPLYVETNEIDEYRWGV